MFVNESKHNKVVEENQNLTQQNEELRTQLQAATENSATLQKQVEDITAERNSLTEKVSEVSGQLGQANEKITALEHQVADLTAQNAELSKLPGSEPARTISKTEASHEGNVSEIDRVNEFCRKNSENINACLQEVEKLYK